MIREGERKMKRVYIGVLTGLMMVMLAGYANGVSYEAGSYVGSAQGKMVPSRWR